MTTAMNEEFWSPIFETGNAELDEQHRNLLEESALLKKLASSGAKSSDIRACIEKLANRCVAHFRAEERILSAAKFPRCAEHEALHRQVEKKLKDLVSRVAVAGDTDAQCRSLVASLDLALLDIIARHDLDYKSHLMDVSGY